MKQNPSKLKFKKYQKFGGSLLSLFEQKNISSLRTYGLKALEPGHLTFPEIEACRKAIKRGSNNNCDFKINVFCCYPITKKPVASRMGKGKGGHSRWIAPVRSGYLICEVSNISKILAYKVLKGISAKLSVKVKIIELKY